MVQWSMCIYVQLGVLVEVYHMVYHLTRFTKP